MIPKSLNGVTNFGLTIRCYIPGKVTGGYISSPAFNQLETAISTSAGLIKVSFPTLPGLSTRTSYLPFANALQMSQNRYYVDAEDVGAQKNKLDLSAFEKAQSGEIDENDLQFIPLLSGERILDSVKSIPVYLPFCKLANGDFFCRENKYPEADRLANLCCFPILPNILTCFLRPFVSNSEIIITKNTIFHYNRIKNNGLCGCMGPIMKGANPFWPCWGSTLCCQSNDNIFVAWKPVLGMQGQSVYFNYDGEETFWSRCCVNQRIGNFFCPLTQSTYVVEVEFDDVKFQAKGREANHNFKTNPGIKNSQMLINTVQVATSQTMLRDSNFADMV